MALRGVSRDSAAEPLSRQVVAREKSEETPAKRGTKEPVS